MSLCPSDLESANHSQVKSGCRNGRHGEIACAALGLADTFVSLSEGLAGFGMMQSPDGPAVHPSP